MRVLEYDFPFKSTARLLFDPGFGTKFFEPNWCIMQCDEEIARYYKWFLSKEKVEIFEPNKIWGFHASVIKGEVPMKNQDKWKEFQGKQVEFWYGNHVSYSNGRHAWLNCYCEDLSDVREFFGLDVKDRKLKYHMTLGRLKNPTEPDVKRPGVIYEGEGSLFSI